MDTRIKIKTITSHVGLSRFLAECSEAPIGQVLRRESDGIRSPYSYSQTWIVFDWLDSAAFGPHVPVFVAEVAHKVYHVYRVTEPLLPVETS